MIVVHHHRDIERPYQNLTSKQVNRTAEISPRVFFHQTALMLMLLVLEEGDEHSLTAC